MKNSPGRSLSRNGEKVASFPHKISQPWFTMRSMQVLTILQLPYYVQTVEQDSLRSPADSIQANVQRNDKELIFFWHRGSVLLWSFLAPGPTSCSPRTR